MVPAYTELAPNARRFAIRFVVAAALLLGLYAFPYADYGFSEQWFSSYLHKYARVVGWALNFFESDVSVQGATVTGRASLLIAKSCDAMDAKLLFAAAVLAYPGRPSRKALALVAGIVGLTVLNVARIVALYFVLVKRQQSFDFFHLEVMPLALVLAALLLFVASIYIMRSSPGTLKADVKHAVP